MFHWSCFPIYLQTSRAVPRPGCPWRPLSQPSWHTCALEPLSSCWTRAGRMHLCCQGTTSPSGICHPGVCVCAVTCPVLVVYATTHIAVCCWFLGPSLLQLGRLDCIRRLTWTASFRQHGWRPQWAIHCCVADPHRRVWAFRRRCARAPPCAAVRVAQQRWHATPLGKWFPL